jgi:hypothetical protein
VSEEIISELAEKFGAQETEEYLRLMKAVRSLVHLWSMFLDADEGSVVEVVLADQIEKMMKQLEEHPDHASSIVEALIALIMHLRRGGEYDDWFKSAGIAPIPGGDE